MNRRTLLGTSSAALASSLAGCSQILFANTEGSPEPHIDQQVLDEGGWELLNQEPLSETVTVEQFGVSQAIDVTGRTDVYEDRSLRSYVTEETLGQLNQPIRIIFTTKLKMDPNPAAIRGGIADGIVLDEMESIFHNRFVSTLESYGISDVEKSGDEGSLEINTGETARFYEYSGQYEYSDLRIRITEDEDIVLPGGAVKFNAAYGLWISDGFVLAAGGGYPAEDVYKETSASLTDSISADIEVDLDLHDDEYSSELKDLVATVE